MAEAGVGVSDTVSAYATGAPAACSWGRSNTQGSWKRWSHISRFTRRSGGVLTIWRAFCRLRSQDTEESGSVAYTTANNAAAVTEIARLVAETQAEGKADNYGGKRHLARYTRPLQLEATKDPGNSRAVWRTSMHNFSSWWIAAWSRRPLWSNELFFCEGCFLPDESPVTNLRGPALHSRTARLRSWRKIRVTQIAWGLLPLNVAMTTEALHRSLSLGKLNGLSGTPGDLAECDLVHSRNWWDLTRESQTNRCQRPRAFPEVARALASAGHLITNTAIRCRARSVGQVCGRERTGFPQILFSDPRRRDSTKSPFTRPI